MAGKNAERVPAVSEGKVGEDQTKYAQTPAGYQALWKTEFDESDKFLEKFHKQANETLKRYIDDRTGMNTGGAYEKRTNLFNSSIRTKQAMMFGNRPKTDVVRKYDDTDDDVGRVSAEMMQRVLNSSAEEPDDNFVAANEHVLDDFLTVSFGVSKHRYEAELRKAEAVPAVMEPQVDEMTGAPMKHGNGRPMLVEKAPAVPAHDEKVWENVATDYFHWRDVKWSECKVWEEMRWASFRTPMTRKQLVDRFGKKGEKVPLNYGKRDREDVEHKDEQENFPWDRAEVWEIWSKEHGKVFWFVRGMRAILEVEDDPYELAAFWPFQKWMMDGLTTSKMLPKPIYLIAQDMYLEIETLTTRIGLLQKALRVVGVFDETFKDALQNLMEETDENAMVAVPEWAMFAERGGMDGAVSWFPVEQVAKVLTELRQQRQEDKGLLFEITGDSDIMRGQTDPRETLGAQQIKSRFASARMQRNQDMFAEYVSEGQTIRAEMIAKFYEPDELKRRSNIMSTKDAEYADQAIELLKTEGVNNYRIAVKSDQLALTDFASKKQDRVEFLTGMTTFFKEAGPIVAADPLLFTLFGEALKAYAAGFRGMDALESCIDKYISAKEKQMQAMQQGGGPPGVDPAVQAQQLKNEQTQMQGQQQQEKHGMEMQKIQAETQQHTQEAQVDTQSTIMQARAQAQADALSAASGAMGQPAPRSKVRPSGGRR